MPGKAQYAISLPYPQPGDAANDVVCETSSIIFTNIDSINCIWKMKNFSKPHNYVLINNQGTTSSENK